MVIGNNSNTKPSITILYLEAEPSNNQEYQQVLLICRELDPDFTKKSFDINYFQSELPALDNDNTVIILWLDCNIFVEWKKDRACN